MSGAELPAGRYLTCTWAVKPDGGGQMRAMLARNRMLRDGGVLPQILSFVPALDFEERRAALFERSQLLPGMGLDSIYDYYREHDWPSAAPSGKPLADLSGHVTSEETRADGSPWRITYSGSQLDKPVFDYLRRDGSPYLRIPHFSFSQASTWPKRIQKVSREGEVIGHFGSLGQWFRGWVRELAEAERAFVFLETRVLTPHLVPIKAPNIHLIQVMHNVHTKSPQRWDSPVAPLGQLLLDRMSDLDAVVNLTQRQREDIALRRGATKNMFVVPNPVQMPRDSLDTTRDPRLATIVARLATQKRLTHAVMAFEKVLRELPDARLEIFGDGLDRDHLESFIVKRGLSSSVILRGYDPDARAALNRSSVFLMTSRNEGYPLSTLESMSHGCPVVSYDIKYGPREQITHGVDGFLVPDGNIKKLAERVTQLLRSPELVAQMSRAAVLKAREHSPERYAEEWSNVLHTVVRQKQSRTSITSARLEVTRMSIARPGPLGRLLGRVRSSPPGVYPGDAVLSFRGVLTVEGRGAPETLQAARIELAAVQQASGEVVELPVEVTQEGMRFEISAKAPLAPLLGPAGAAEQAYLRLRLVWENSAWNVQLSWPPEIEAAHEAGSSPDETPTIQRPAPGRA